MGMQQRQVQHVAGLQHKFFFRLKVGQDFQGHIRLQGSVGLAPDAPAPATLCLQQKHVVAVEVRSHTATIGGVADHQIIEPGVRHKSKLVHQRMHGVMLQIDPLHQHRPTRAAQSWQGTARKRPELELPARRLAGLLHHQTGLPVLVPGQFKQRRPVQQRLEVGNSLADQQGLFLPVPFHE